MRKEANDPFRPRSPSHSSNYTGAYFEEVDAPVRQCDHIPLIVAYSTTKMMESTPATATATATAKNSSAGQSTGHSSSGSSIDSRMTSICNNKRKVSNVDDHEGSTTSSVSSHHRPPKKRFCQRKEAASAVVEPMLLAQPGDEEVLSPLHCFVRRQIEVFEATSEELAQPAPGRKVPIKLRQVGLRCIHCTSTKNLLVGNNNNNNNSNGKDSPTKRVKRAVCYPSSVARIYHSVSDMKFDHFGRCTLLPTDVRETFERLKMEAGTSHQRPSSSSPSTKNKKASKRGSGSKSQSSTAQFYHESAVRMGMVDGPGGIFMKHGVQTNVPSPVQDATDDVASSSSVAISPAQNVKAVKTVSPVLSGASDLVSCTKDLLPLSSDIDSLLQQYEKQKQNVIPRPPSAVPSSLVRHDHTTENHSKKKSKGTCKDTQEFSTNDNDNRHTRDTETTVTIPVSDSGDVDYLNPLHCFVRRHIEFFVADANACSEPSPGRKSPVVVGQVGLRCIHCANLPPKQRVKRSICYPPSITGIYHAVSNMKFDHFAICKGLPEASRQEFADLRNSCSRRGTATGSTNCTKQNKTSTTQTTGVKPNKHLKGTKSTSSSDSSTGSSGVSTGQYYAESAASKGLVDSDIGIRFVGSGGDHSHGDHDGGVRRFSVSSQALQNSTTTSTTTTTNNNNKDVKTPVSFTSRTTTNVVKSNLTGLSALVMAACQAV